MAVNAAARARTVKPFTVRKRIALAVMVGVLAGLLGQVLHMTRTIEQVELATLNWRVQQTADPVSQDSDIVVVALDQAAIDYVESATSDEGRGHGWPWPRDQYLQFLSFCERAGARVVVIDLFFIDPHKDRAEQDGAFAEALANCDVPIVMAAQCSLLNERSRPGELDYRAQLTIDPAALKHDGEPLNLLTDRAPLTPYRDLVEGELVTTSTDPLDAATYETMRVLDMTDPFTLAHVRSFGPLTQAGTSGITNPQYGAVAVEPEADGIYRRYGALTALDGRARDAWVFGNKREGTSASATDTGEYPVTPVGTPGLEVHASVALRLLMTLEGVDTVEQISDRELRVGQYTIPVDENGRMLLKYSQRRDVVDKAELKPWEAIHEDALFPVVRLHHILHAERLEWNRREIEDTFAVNLCNLLLEQDAGSVDERWSPLVDRANTAMSEFETDLFDWYGELETVVSATVGDPYVAFDPQQPTFAPLRAALAQLSRDTTAGVAVRDPGSFAARVAAALSQLAVWFDFVNDATAETRDTHLPLGLPLSVVEPLAALLAHAPGVPIDGAATRSSAVAVLEGTLRDQTISRMRALDVWPVDLEAMAGEPFDARRNGDLELALQGIQAEAAVAWSRWQAHMVDAYLARAQPKIDALAAEQVAMASDALAILGNSEPSDDALSVAARELAEVRETALNALPEPSIDPSVLEGKIVLLGATAPGLLDIRPNPVASLGYGVDLHATAIDNIINGEHLHEAPQWLHIVVVFGLAIVAALLAFFLPGLTYALPVDLGLIAGYSIIALIAFDSADLWLPWTAPVIGIVAGYAGASVAIYVAIGRDKRLLKGAMSQYMGKELVTVVEKHPDKLKLGGDRRELSVYFSDVAGFTSISEKLAPEQLVVLLNRYLSSMTDIILGTGGIIDKYIGDAVMAVWGAPFDLDNHAASACKAALTCKRSLDKLRPLLIEEGFPALHARAGVNSGPAVAGNMGSDLRFSYTVMGDTVNLAARLEPWCKEVGAHILIGERTYELAKDHIEARLVDKLQAKGKEEAVPIYELIALKGELTESQAAMIEAHRTAFLYFLDRNWDKAMDLATDALRAEPDDEVSKHLMVRCMDYKENPPPTNWDGRTIMRHK